MTNKFIQDAPPATGFIAPELFPNPGLHDSIAGAPTGVSTENTTFLLGGLANRSTEIHERLLSSSLTPSFARGRHAAAFIPRSTARCGGPASEAGCRGAR